MKRNIERTKFHFIFFDLILDFFLYFSSTIMVNRGWIPRSDRSTFKEGNEITDPVEIIGIIRATEKRPPFVPENNPKKSVWHYR